MTLSMQLSEPQNARIPQAIHAILLDDSTFDRARIRRLAKDTDLPMQLQEVGNISDLQVAIRQATVDLIMIDYRLPVGDGLMVLESLQQDPTNKDAATIMITGNGDLDTAVAAMRLGCHDFLTKDKMTAQDLRKAMVNALAIAKKRRKDAGGSDVGVPNIYGSSGLGPMGHGPSGKFWTTQDPIEIAELLAGLDEDDEFVFH